MDSKAFFKMSYGLYLVTSSYEKKESGCIANTFVQVTSTPAQVCITLNKNNFTTELISKSGVFNCGVLLDEIEMPTIANFGFQSGKDVDKFSGFEFFLDKNGVKQISKDLAATLTCKVVNQMDVGTHIIFVASVEDAEILSDKPVLTYANYHAVKKGSTPKNASSYQEPTETKGFKCTICNYVLDASELPEDYKCPICGQPASVFEKM